MADKTNEEIRKEIKYELNLQREQENAVYR